MENISRVFFHKSDLNTHNYQLFPVPEDLSNWYVAEIDLADLDQFEFIYPENGENNGEPLLVRKAPNEFSKFDFNKKQWVTDFTKGNKFLQDKVDNQTTKLYDYIENGYEKVKEEFGSKYSSIESYLLEYQKANFEGKAPIKLALFLKRANLTGQEAYDKCTKLKEYIESSKDLADNVSYEFYDKANLIVASEDTFETKSTKLDELFNTYINNNKQTLI